MLMLFIYAVGAPVEQQVPSCWTSDASTYGTWFMNSAAAPPSVMGSRAVKSRKRSAAGWNAAMYRLAHNTMVSGLG